MLPGCIEFPCIHAFSYDTLQNNNTSLAGLAAQQSNTPQPVAARPTINYAATMQPSCPIASTSSPNMKSQTLFLPRVLRNSLYRAMFEGVRTLQAPAPFSCRWPRQGPRLRYCAGQPALCPCKPSGGPRRAQRACVRAHCAVLLPRRAPTTAGRAPSWRTGCGRWVMHPGPADLEQRSPAAASRPTARLCATGTRGTAHAVARMQSQC